MFAASSADAFSPKTNFAANKNGLIVPSSESTNDKQQSTGLWTPNAMKMVAGGAERAYGQEYYEGAFIFSGGKIVCERCV